MKKTLRTLTTAAALICVAAMATAEAPVATGETAWLRGKPVATYTCAGKTVIPVSALGEYGFDVENGDALKITVNDAEITAEGAPATAGDTLAEVKAETTATLDGQPVVAYTLEDGDAVIALDDCFAYNAEKLSGIDLIVIGTSDLEKSKDFFVTHMELNVVAEGTMDAASVKALYGQEGEAKYAMVMNNVNSTKLMLIEFREKTGKTTREGFHAWDYGYFDVAWRCNDIDAMYEELTGAGLISADEMMECLALRSRDNARTPVQWDDSPNAGFTTGTPWIEVNPNYTAINAAAEEKDPDSVLNYYKQMIALRKSHLGLIYGSFQLLAEENHQVFAYRRTLAETGENYLIACNFSDKDAAFTIPADFAGARRLIGNYPDTAPTGAVTLRPYEAFVLQK